MSLAPQTLQNDIFLFEMSSSGLDLCSFEMPLCLNSRARFEENAFFFAISHPIEIKRN